MLYFTSLSVAVAFGQLPVARYLYETLYRKREDMGLISKDDK
jgi:hypothetical protein